MHITWDIILETLGFSIGLLYLWWEYNADSRLWIASIVMPTISMWIYFHKGLYADFGINIYYFVIAIYGYWVWNHGRKKQSAATVANDSAVKSGNPDFSAEGVIQSLRISHIPMNRLLICIAVALLLWAALWGGLHFLTDSSVPIADAFTTALSIVGMWMLARKYIEQWIVWIAVDAVCVGLYMYKGLCLYSILYAIYTVIACIGYRKWRRLMLSSK